MLEIKTRTTDDNIIRLSSHWCFILDVSRSACRYVPLRVLSTTYNGCSVSSQRVWCHSVDRLCYLVRRGVCTVHITLGKQCNGVKSGDRGGYVIGPFKLVHVNMRPFGCQCK
jgi:hypothetical protein